MNKTFVWNVFKYLLAAGLLTYVVWSNWESKSGQPGLSAIWQKHAVEGDPIHFGFLALAFCIFTAAVFLTFVRWFYLVRGVGLPFTLTNGFRLGLVGFFFNTFLPGSVGGDLAKAYFIAREHSRRWVAVATVIIDRGIALWALVWFVAISGTGFWAAGFLENRIQAQSIVISALIIVAVSLLVWIGLGFLPEYQADRFAGRLNRIPKIGHTLAEFWRAVWIYRCRPSVVYTAMLISFVGHVGFVMSFYFGVLVLWDPADPGQKIPEWFEHFLIVPIGMVIQAVPLFPGGAGIGELGYSSLYKLLGCSPANAVLGSLVLRLISWVLGLFGCAVYLRMKPGLQSAVKDDSNDSGTGVPPV